MLIQIPKITVTVSEHYVMIMFQRFLATFNKRTFPRPFSSVSNIKSVYHNVKKYPNKAAIIDQTGTYTFSNIFIEAQVLSDKITQKVNGKLGEKVLFLCPNDASYVITVWAIWMSGQIAVPLSPLHPEPLLEYYINDTRSKLIIATTEYKKSLKKLAEKTQSNFYALDKDLLDRARENGNCLLNNTDSLVKSEEALILYTSGTTGKPKGVVITHKNIITQLDSLIQSWKWTCNDSVLHTLPLNHVHGTISALFCPLYAGASVVMLPKFHAPTVCDYLLNKSITVFLAVPTIYSKLIDEFQAKYDPNKVREVLRKNIRLMVSGSAPLPDTLFVKWLEISGHRLLERYGMTEIGMCLSNEYDENEREPGFVGLPLPSVSVALSDQETGQILLTCTNLNGKIEVEGAQGDVTGELLVKGDSVFKEYYNKPEETSREFTKDDNWFKTGDIAQYVADKNKFRLLGRKSADIIKSRGYKISALQIETILLEHDNVKECAVLGVNDPIYGEKIVAVIALANPNSELGLEELKQWAKGKMPHYWIPQTIKIVDQLPRNYMGKVNKNELKRTL
ncbi:hypothetical protein ABEB36_011760 [Hypothenemus hampei]|uniref:Acyl-CoA synthetase family member 3, mitochondrial n=1 Tax=Hypothenemus hampei TaxID=57062 RepID=A0ABD1E9S4_HYPHA